MWEQTRVYHVSAADGNDDNNGLAGETAFATIQAGIGAALGGEEVLVWPGVYSEELDFLGKAITVEGAEDGAVISAPGYDAISFYHEEDGNSVLKNFIITNSDVGFWLLGASPTIENVTVTDCNIGADASGGAEPVITNSIFWNNRDADLLVCDARYSCIERGSPGQGNISIDPCFVDADNGDYRLKSEGWRWDETRASWTWGDVTSLCIDAGNPGTPLHNEPESIAQDPNNVWGVNLRVNMGAYGGTSQASIPPHGWALLADLNNDRRLNWFDLAAQLEDWLQYDNEQPGDLNRDGVVNGEDFTLLAGEWTDVGEGMGTVDFRAYWPFGVGNWWGSEVIPDAGFALVITDNFFVNGFEIWEFTNWIGDLTGGHEVTEYYVYVDGTLYATENLSDLDNLPAISGTLEPRYPQIVQLGRPIYVPDLGRGAPRLGNVTAVRGTLSDVLKSTSFTVEDFPLGDQDDVIAF
ncbi:MAG: right-handed parallel beta-helix repeat-containing protein, partial [Planctomycetota bacterium]